jgi:hypothetical protein
MRRIDTATKAVDLFGAGKHGFKDGDPALAILATKLNAAFFNSIQEELSRAIEGAGFTLAPADNTQLLAAITALARGVLPKRSFAANDYIRIPDVPGGLIIQWRSYSSPSTAQQTVTYPITFPNNVLGWAPGAAGSAGQTVTRSGAISNSNIELTTNAISQSHFLIFIGY